MKKAIKLLGIVMLGFCLAIGVSENKVRAEGEEETTEVVETEEESKVSKWYGEKIEPALVWFSTGSGIAAVGLFVSVLRLISSMKKNKEDNDLKVKTLKSEFGKAIDKVVEETNKTKEALINQVDKLEKRIHKFERNQEKSLEVQKIAFTNDPDLVRDGYAKEIENVIDGE